MIKTQRLGKNTSSVPNATVMALCFHAAWNAPLRGCYLISSAPQSCFKSHQKFMTTHDRLTGVNYSPHTPEWHNRLAVQTWDDTYCKVNLSLCSQGDKFRTAGFHSCIKCKCTTVLTCGYLFLLKPSFLFHMYIYLWFNFPSKIHIVKS